MEIETPNGSWQDGGDHWKEETENGDRGKAILHVLVMYEMSTSCFGSDKDVKIVHSDEFDAKLSRTNNRANVKPHKSFTKKTDHVLRYDAKNSYIKEIQVGKTTCPIADRKLEAVCISGKLPMKCSK